MKFKCTYSRDNDEVFTVGQIYEGEFSYTDNHGDNWYQAKNNAGINSKILLDGWFWKFEIVEEEEKEDMKENQACVRGLEALKLMEANGTVFQQLYTSPTLYYKMMNGSLYRSDYPDKDWALNGTFNTNASFIPYVPKPSTGWERVDENKEEKFTIITSRRCDNLWELNNSDCDDLYKNANYFSTKEKAEEINFKQTLFRKLQRFSDENGGLDIDWNDGSQTKWSIYYGYGFKTMVVDNCWQTREFGQVYFSSKEVAEEAVELFHDDLIKYFTM